MNRVKELKDHVAFGDDVWGFLSRSVSNDDWIVCRDNVWNVVGAMFQRVHDDITFHGMYWTDKSYEDTYDTISKQF
jgi:hypothetical protein